MVLVITASAARAAAGEADEKRPTGESVRGDELGCATVRSAHSAELFADAEGTVDQVNGPLQSGTVRDSWSVFL